MAPAIAAAWSRSSNGSRSRRLHMSAIASDWPFLLGHQVHAALWPPMVPPCQ
jgi:hypothetical protein